MVKMQAHTIFRAMLQRTALLLARVVARKVFLENARTPEDCGCHSSTAVTKGTS
jgi:hypothetical protein